MYDMKMTPFTAFITSRNQQGTVTEFRDTGQFRCKRLGRSL